MKKMFPAYFRPTESSFSTLWKNCIFSVDANVILNLYRYSPETRQELEKTLSSVKDQLFIPHQAAKEFLKNRLGVTAGQADEYTKSSKIVGELATMLTNKKKHPFLDVDELKEFSEYSTKLLRQLESHRTELLNRLNADEILDFIESLFSDATGSPLSDTELKAILSEGEVRYQSEIPPGYKDGKKDASGDPNRKFGDLIVWKQLIKKAKEASKPIIFITDDKKEDWWLEQSGKTIGPRTELREEFIKETAHDFWMYTVDRFMEECARVSNTKVNEQAIAEIIEVSEEVKLVSEESAARLPSSRIVHPVLSESELLDELCQFLDSHPSEDGSVGLKYFVANYLGSQNYEINHSYARLNALAERGQVEIFRKERNGLSSMRVRLASQDQTKEQASVN